MKLYPLEECAREIVSHIWPKGGDFFQQWLCEHCGVKQTMEEKNKLFTSGQCEECGKITDIRKTGCNYMVVYGPPNFGEGE